LDADSLLASSLNDGFGILLKSMKGEEKMKQRLLTSLTVICALGMSAGADTVNLAATDASGQHSYDTGTNWDDSSAPVAGNDYVVSREYNLRTEAGVAGTTFGGDSLTLNGSGALSLLGSNNTTYTVNHLISDNGKVNAGAANYTYFLDGNITIQSGGFNANMSTHSSNRWLIIDADITGTGGLNVIGGASGKTKKVTLNGQAAYTGSTSINAYTTLVVANSLLFDVNDGSNSDISGSGFLDMYSTMRLDVADVTTDGSWNLIDVTNLTERYNDDFSVALAGGQAFAESEGVWTLLDGNNSWEFTESTGVLTMTVVPEPTTLLLAGGSLGVLLRRKRV
jgi:hypothetical protein